MSAAVGTSSPFGLRHSICLVGLFSERLAVDIRFVRILVILALHVTNVLAVIHPRHVGRSLWIYESTSRPSARQRPAQASAALTPASSESEKTDNAPMPDSTGK